MPGISEGAFVTLAMVTVEVKLFKTFNSYELEITVRVNCVNELLSADMQLINMYFIFTFLHKLKKKSTGIGKVSTL